MSFRTKRGISVLRFFGLSPQNDSFAVICVNPDKSCKSASQFKFEFYRKKGENTNIRQTYLKLSLRDEAEAISKDFSLRSE